jgi:hypothetical protein
MTIRYVGGLSAAVAAPHVYLIISCGCVYIGETQRHPVGRWTQHLSPEGSLRLALNAQDDVVFYPVRFPSSQSRSVPCRRSSQRSR